MRPVAILIARLSTICVAMQSGSKEPADESPSLTPIRCELIDEKIKELGGSRAKVLANVRKNSRCRP
jgi:hypothetical protein